MLQYILLISTSLSSICLHQWYLSESLKNEFIYIIEFLWLLLAVVTSMLNLLVQSWNTMTICEARDILLLTKKSWKRTWFKVNTSATIQHNIWGEEAQEPLEIFLNVFSEFSDKKFYQYSKRVQTCSLLCKRSGCYHSTSKTQVRDKIFKLSPIHASLIY